MSLKKLTNPGAFGQGADLWIIPDPRSSAWARKIDWYLNLQIQRAKNHQPKKISEELIHILELNEIQLKDVCINENTPLLVNSHKHLPNRSVLHVPMANDQKQWILDCLKIWEDLSEPTVRFFLPEEVSEEALEKHWPKQKQAGVTYVLSQSPIEE